MSRFRPHPSLKQELSSDQKKIRSFVVIAGLVILVGVVAGILVWLFFSSKNFSTASLTPIDSELYMKLEWRESSQQNTNLNNLSLSLGGPTTIDDFLHLMIPSKFGNTAVNFQSDIAPWISDDVAIVRRHLGNKDEDIKLFVASDKDKEQAFLDKITREADTTAKESYKGYQIESLFGTAQVAYAQIGNTVAFAGKPQVLHDVIDVAVGDTKPLTKASDFKVTQQHLDTNVVLSTFMDIAPFLRQPGVLGLSESAALSLSGKARVGITMAAKENGFGLQIFIPSPAKDGVKNNFNNDILAVTPNNIAGYIGASDLSSFAKQYLATIFNVKELKDHNITQDTIRSKYGVDLDQDLFSWMQGQYALVSTELGKSDFALIFKVDNKDQTQAAMRKVEKAIVGISKELSKEPDKIPSEFSESAGARYLALGGKTNTYLNYTFKDNFLIFATNRETLDLVVKGNEGQPKLLNSKQYELVTKDLPSGNASGGLYFSGDFVLGFLKSLGFNLSAFNRHVVGLGIKSINETDGKMITGFLPIL